MLVFQASYSYLDIAAWETSSPYSILSATTGYSIGEIDLAGEIILGIGKGRICSPCSTHDRLS